MVSAATIRTEESLGKLLERCGFSSDTDSRAPWTTWRLKWEGKKMPICRYLTDFPNSDYFVTVEGDSFRVYWMDQLNDWFYVVGELRGEISEQELCSMILRAVHKEAPQ